MKKWAVVAVIPLFAGFLLAQDQSTRTETKTTTTTYNGTLIDASCYTTHSEHKETSTEANREGGTTTKTETTHTENTQCPVTTTTTTFGLLTPSGQYVRFDDPSNTKIVETVKVHKNWVKAMEEHQPVKVTVVGSPSGDVVIMKEIK